MKDSIDVTERFIDCVTITNIPLNKCKRFRLPSRFEICQITTREIIETANSPPAIKQFIH